MTNKFSKFIAAQIRDDFENKEGLIKLHLKHCANTRPPILLVPGSFCGAWLWRDNFMEFFHNEGYDVAAMSFAGHGQRGWPLWKRGLKDFENDLIDAIAQLDTPPILLAHSLGGLIAQRVARKVPVAGLALLSPIPLHGVGSSLVQLGQKSPASLLKFASVMFEPRLARLAQAPLGVFSAQMDQEVRDATSGRLQAESPLALLQSLLPDPSANERFHCPVHFWGAEHDYVISSSEVVKASKAVGAEATIYPGLSHFFPIEPTWKTIAGDILKVVSQWTERTAGESAR